MSSTKSFENLKEQCLKEGRLYEDSDFPAEHRSLYFSKVIPSITWKRPTELCAEPKLVVDKASRFDLDQGALGDCWYIAAAATVACKPELFNRVVPRDQGFKEGQYAGIFRFHFWRYGQWVEVVIDDRLPVKHGRFLVFCSNREEPNEFWSALLEKAYAKLHGSYEALEGGWTEDALVDMTGGVGERIDLTNKQKIPEDFFKTLLYIHKMNSLMGCSIMSSKETMENTLPNGLVIGHAYSITSVIRANVKGQLLQMLRLRNPWGKREWNGPWSDGSKEWKSISEKERQSIGLQYDEDGEFWMSFADWAANFQQLQMCHLPPDGPLYEDKSGWKTETHHGAWVKGVSAGGCGQSPYEELYWSNPQFKIKVTEPDNFYDDGKCTLAVSLMQKYRRLLRSYYRTEMANVPIGFDIYKLTSDINEVLTEENFEDHARLLERSVDPYTFCREMTKRLRVEPGFYAIIPSTYPPNVQAEFLLRMFTEGTAVSNEIDVQTGAILAPVITGDTLKDLFAKYAGHDGVVDARELCKILNEAFKKDIGSGKGFELESCRSLLSMMDLDQSGVLEFDELRKMWTELKTWQGAFQSFDKDKSGSIDMKELKNLFSSIGFNLSRKVRSSIVLRYGGKGGQLSFNDFLVVASKVVVMLELFGRYSKKGLKGKAELSLEDWLHTTLYF